MQMFLIRVFVDFGVDYLFLQQFQMDDDLLFSSGSSISTSK